LGGCGGSGSPSSPPSAGHPATPSNTSTSAASPGHGEGARAQYAAFAKAVNLQPQDVAGFAASVKKRSKHKNPTGNAAFGTEAEYQHCVGGGKELKPILNADSDEFKSGQGLHFTAVSSNVKVMSAIAAAHAELARARKLMESPSVRACLARMVDAFGTHGQIKRLGGTRMRITVGGLRIAPLQAGSIASGADGSYGLSLSIHITYTVYTGARTVEVPAILYVDGLTFGVGRAEISLATDSLGEQFPPELEAKLYANLVSRALAAARQYPAIQS
jgi:hypothetical protein